MSKVMLQKSANAQLGGVARDEALRDPVSNEIQVSTNNSEGAGIPLAELAPDPLRALGGDIPAKFSLTNDDP